MKDGQGRPVILFHLKRFWDDPRWLHVEVLNGIRYCRPLDLYEEIKSGRKTSEFRDATEYWIKRTANAIGSRAWFVVGYPKGNLPRLEATITELEVSGLRHQIEIKFRDVVEEKVNG